MLQNVWNDRYAQIGRLEAEEAMRLSQVMVYPTLTAEGSASMWKSWSLQAAGTAVARAVGSLRAQFGELRLWAAGQGVRL